MSLDDLTDDVEAAYGDLDDVGALDSEARTELAMLVAALDPDDPEELVRRGVHLLFQTTVDSGKLDFHLRSRYGVTYDEYLSGMTYDEMAGGEAGDGTDFDPSQAGSGYHY
ncbi:MAG: hypothetical protein ABEJ08_04475 [Halobacteriaceae archaeon]